MPYNFYLHKWVQEKQLLCLITFSKINLCCTEGREWGCALGSTKPAEQLCCVLKFPCGKRALLQQPKECLICSECANHLNWLLIERPVNYPSAGVILFAVYKQKDGVWLALRNAASGDNRFRALWTKAWLYDLFVGMEFNCLIWSDKNAFSPFKSCFAWKVQSVERGCPSL